MNSQPAHPAHPARARSPSVSGPSQPAPRRPGPSWGAGWCVCAALLLGACSSTAPPRFHSLLSAAPPAAPPPATPVLAWQVALVSLPTQVDQPQWVVRRADNTLVVLEQERWIAPLQDELRAALTEHLTHTLGAAGARPDAGRKDWRVALEVSRFDSAPGRTLLVVQWSVLAVGGVEAALRCRSAFEQSVAADMAAIAQGHRQALQRLGAAVAPALQSLDAGRVASCG